MAAEALIKSEDATALTYLNLVRSELDCFKKHPLELSLYEDILKERSQTFL